MSFSILTQSFHKPCYASFADPLVRQAAGGPVDDVVLFSPDTHPQSAWIPMLLPGGTLTVLTPAAHHQPWRSFFEFPEFNPVDTDEVKFVGIHDQDHGEVRVTIYGVEGNLIK